MKRTAVIVILIACAFILGIFIGGDHSDNTDTEKVHNQTVTTHKSEIWTCSMHPQIRLPGPGQCPICAMDLIPASQEEDQNLGFNEIKMTPAAIKLADIQTAKVVRMSIPAQVRLTGKVDYDESAVKNITARIPGRLDRLFVDYTGIVVKKGDHMVQIYSPELLTAQQELIQAKKSVMDFRESTIKIMRESSIKTLEASREKLRLWGLNQEQINAIEESSRVTDHITIYSPISGIVIEKRVDEGAYVETGTVLYRVADLSKVWVKLEAYESDIMWLRYGQKVDIETEAYPGELFTGTISFIDPILDTKTRTIKIRVNVPNSKGKLKPGMLVRSIVYSSTAQSGRVMDESLAGKWICPMHPEVIKAKEGDCDICGMPLVKTESLGYTIPDKSTGRTNAPLVIPASAPLITGKRAIVYIAVPEKPGTFQGREVTLGTKVGDYYIIDEGLIEGEMVVTNGNFKIDSALQILAKPSMMSPDGGTIQTGHDHDTGIEKSEQLTKSNDQLKDTFKVPAKFKDQIDNLLFIYFKIQDALAKDDTESALTQGISFRKAVEEVDMALLDGEAHMEWMKDLDVLKSHASTIGTNSDIEIQRKSFEPISETLKAVLKKFGSGGSETVIVFHCPMAFNNKGADWLQNHEDLLNPYFGKKMLTCGEKRETLVTGE